MNGSLKPCTHCGQTEDGLSCVQYQSYETGRGEAVYVWWHVTCRQCTADVAGATEAEARERWNRRDERDALIAERDCYEATLRTYADTNNWREDNDECIPLANVDYKPVWNHDGNGYDLARAALEQEKKIGGGEMNTVVRPARSTADLRYKAVLMQLADLALANEQTERDLYIAHLQRDPEAVTLIHHLQNGLCKAARIARTVLEQG